MYNPVAGNDKKRSIISKIQKDAGLQSYTANFLNLILDRGRIEALENIFEAFEQEYCKRTDTQVRLRSTECFSQQNWPSCRLVKPNLMHWCCSTPVTREKSCTTLRRLLLDRCVNDQCWR